MNHSYSSGQNGLHYPEHLYQNPHSLAQGRSILRSSRNIGAASNYSTGRLLKIDVVLKVLAVLLLSGLYSLSSYSQPLNTLYVVNVAADHADWTYKCGESVHFNITVTVHGNVVKNTKISIQIGPEQMPSQVILEKTISGPITIDGGTMNTPGFRRCIVVVNVDGHTYRGIATAAFDPEQIKATTNVPNDFIPFWQKAMEANAKIPLDAKLTLLPERCTERTSVYQLNVQNFALGSRIYGILCVPKKSGKYPAILELPGAGVRPYLGDIDMADKGVITLQIGIHGIPVVMEPNVYNDLYSSGLKNYPTMNLDDKDQYYYKRVFMGCIRANDYLTSMPEFNGQLAVSGGSQGGMLSIVTAGLDKRVRYVAALFPAMADLTGYLHGRAGGWPHMFRSNVPTSYITKERVETTKYYDVVNFAKLITIPGIYHWGYNDEVCPPTTSYAAYNGIDAPKELIITQESGHWVFPEPMQKIKGWLMQHLTKNH